MEEEIEILTIEQLNDFVNKINETEQKKLKSIVINFIKEGEIDFNLEFIKIFLKDIKYDKIKMNLESFKINYLSIDGVFLNNEQNKILKQIEKFLNSKNIVFKVGQQNFLYQYFLDDQIKASKILENIVNKINESVLYNKKKVEVLSPFEKFMIVYELVSRFAYNEGKDYYHKATSNWAPVLLGNKIVCAGYSSLMKAICNRISTREEITIYEQGIDLFNENLNFIGCHSNILVRLKDEKYNINGIFYADACWDSIQKGDTSGGAKYCLLTVNEMLKQKSLKKVFNINNPINIYLLMNSTIYRNTLKKLYIKYIKNEETDIEKENNILYKQSFNMMKLNLNLIDEFVLSNSSQNKYLRFLKIFDNLWKETGLIFINKNTEIKINKEEIIKKKIKKIIEKKDKDEKIFDNYCKNIADVQNYICPNNLEFFRKEPLIDVTLDLITQRGYKAFYEEKQLDIICKIISIRQRDLEKYIKENESNEYHYSLQDFIKRYAEEYYYGPLIKKIENNFEKEILSDEFIFLKSIEYTYKLAFNVPSISKKSFRAVFKKVGQIYNLKEKSLDEFIDKKMKDILQRDNKNLQEKENIDKI